MFAVIDCGTTNTRVYVLDSDCHTVGRGERRVGVRNTSMAGSKEPLRQGVCEALADAAHEAGIRLEDLSFAIASGMITSEIGLIELPHLVAPIGLSELASNIELVPPGDILPVPIPILFIRGVRNNYGEAILSHIRHVDFMRGEETQVMGIIDDFQISEPTNIIVLSSHTKLIHIDGEGCIAFSLTSLSGQLYEAICKESMIGKSLCPVENEQSDGYSFEELVITAHEVVSNVGLDRSALIPRFMQVLLRTDYQERCLFFDAAIASDDMKMLADFRELGYHAKRYILFGHEERCKIYAYLIHRIFGDSVIIDCVSSKEAQSELTIRGAIRIANQYIQTQKENSLCFV